MMVRIKPSLKDNIQYINQNVSFTLQNKLPGWNSDNLVYNSSIKIVNTHTVIKINQSYLDEYPQIIKGLGLQKFEFSSNELIFQGTVTNLRLNCEQCRELITGIEPFQDGEFKKLIVYRIANIQPYVNQTSIYLDAIDRKVFILDEQDELLAKYTISEYRYDCQEISSSSNGEFIFTACIKSSAVIHVAQCIQTQTLQCFQYGDFLILEDIGEISNLVISGQYIYVGQLSKDIFLAIYKMINLGNGMKLILIKIFKTSDFGLINFNFQSFLLTSYNNNEQFKILVLSQSKYIIGIDANIQNDQLIFSDDYSIFNIELLFNRFNNFFYKSYNFLQIEEAHTSIFENQNQSLKVFVLIITNHDHYVIKFDFKETNEMLLYYTLSRYSNLKIDGKVAVGNGFVTIQYSDLQGSKYKQLIVYKLPQLPILDKNIFFFFGKIHFPEPRIYYMPRNFQKQNILKVFDSSYYGFYFDIDAKYGVEVNNSDDLIIEQEIELILFNDIDSVLTSIKLRKQELIETVNI